MSLHSRVNVPGLPLHDAAARLPCPVRPSAPSPRYRFAPVRATSKLLARCSFTLRPEPPLPLPPLPFRILTSLRIKAFSKFRCHSARLPISPDFLSLPATGSISRVGYGSPFLVRYVTGD